MSSDSPETPVYSIGSAARLLGISVHTLRMYERENLIIPFKTPAKQRRYSETDIDRVRCIRRAIAEEKIGIAGIQRIQSLIPCWNVISCSNEERDRCPAYTGHTKPCWSYKHIGTTCATRDCRTCDVYRSATDCSKIKDFIVRLSHDGAQPAAAKETV